MKRFSVILTLATILTSAGVIMSTPQSVDAGNDQATYSFNKHYNNVWIGTITVKTGNSVKQKGRCKLQSNQTDTFGQCLQYDTVYGEGLEATIPVKWPSCSGMSQLRGRLKVHWENGRGAYFTRNFSPNHNGESRNYQVLIPGSFSTANGEIRVEAKSWCHTVADDAGDAVNKLGDDIADVFGW